MLIKCRLQEMAASEIAEMVDPEKLADIKRRDPHPLIKAFVVGHEGESKGNLIGVGNVVKRWFKTMIRKLHEKVMPGLELFNGHTVTNEHAGRQPIGQVVGKALKDIGGLESVVVACHVYPEFKHLPLDVASVEADVEMNAGKDGKLDVIDISNVTGIALGNSAIDKPGFAGATLLGQLQAFEAKANKQTGPSLRRVLRIQDTDRPDKLRLV